MEGGHNSHYQSSQKAFLFSPGPVRPNSPVVNFQWQNVYFRTWILFRSNVFFVREKVHCALVHEALVRPASSGLILWLVFSGEFEFSPFRYWILFKSPFVKTSRFEFPEVVRK